MIYLNKFQIAPKTKSCKKIHPQQGIETLSYEKGCARTAHLRKETNEEEYDKDILNPI